MKEAIKSVVRPLRDLHLDLSGEHRKNSDQPRLWVLMYHRCLPKDDIRYRYEEPGMVVTPETFEMHLKELKKFFEIVSLEDWVDRFNRGETLPEKACAITFDDGWKDNYTYAYPILQKHNVPATIFLVTDKIGTNHKFWPNIVSELVYCGCQEQLLKHPQFAKFKFNHRVSDKREAISQLIQELKQLADRSIYRALEEIDYQQLLGQRLPAELKKDQLMSWEEVIEMADSKLVKFGSHTATHHRLTSDISHDDLLVEISKSKANLESKLSRPVKLFCYPNGEMSEEARSLVEQSYQAAVSTEKGVNRFGENSMFSLKRIALHEDVSNSSLLLRARIS